jgi:hypothetical protein
MKLIHIVNVVNFPAHSEHGVAQAITLETLHRAKEEADKHGINVRVLSAQFPEDLCVVPAWMEVTPCLERSSLDYPDFLDKRKLPLISDVLERAIEAMDDEAAMIYSNIDIGVQKNFYVEIAAKLADGHTKTLSITRRTIPKELNSIELLPEMYAHPGESHSGDDCFVFSRQCISQLRLKPVFLGVSWFDKILLLNCAAYCQPFEKLQNEKLTFHIGDALTWLNPKSGTIASYNEKLLVQLIKEIENQQGPAYRNKKFWPHISPIYTMLGFQVKKGFAEVLFENLKKALNLVRRRTYP